ncbi:GNAT family N-acetyltransferase [Fluviispira vulneris]|uniref:GNAT family N-acetyltransferase n=1 Tax=Fluviispira vulneris TaxID=2763012 RepID=UPI0016479056|nr:GNAT family N-acetyltransferase [Fluviispira vulneris]
MENLIHQCENIVKEKFFYIPYLLKDCDVETFEGFKITKSPFMSSMFNIAWLNNVNPIYLESSLNKLINYFNSNPFALWIGPNSSPKQINEILQKLGFVKEAIEIGMTYSLNLLNSAYDSANFKEINNEKFDSNIIKEVNDEISMQHFINVLEKYDPEARIYYLKIANELGFKDNKPYRFFYLEVEGASACIASLFFKEDVCGVFDVLTHDNYRKQGHASKMMKYLLHYAKEHGAKYMGLTASSPEAVNIYKKLGFIEMGEYDCYEYKR